MSRLADRILQSVRPPTGATVDPCWLQSDRELLAQSEVIAFDNVNDSFWAHLPEHKVGPLSSSFPNLAPPFWSFFLETGLKVSLVSTRASIGGQIIFADTHARVSC